MKAIVLSVFFVSTGWAQNTPGHRAAAETCAKITMSRFKPACVAAVSRAYFFSVAAARGCADISMSRYRSMCIQSIANRDYSGAEATACASVSMSKRAAECFARSGRRVPPPTAQARADYRVKLQDTQSELLRILRTLEKNNQCREGERELFKLIVNLKHFMAK